MNNLGSLNSPCLTVDGDETDNYRLYRIASHGPVLPSQMLYLTLTICEGKIIYRKVDNLTSLNPY